MLVDGALPAGSRKGDPGENDQGCLKRIIPALRSPRVNFFITIGMTIGFILTVEAFGLKDTFPILIGFALIEETSKFFFAAHLRHSVRFWKARPVLVRLLWLSAWGLCEVLIKIFGFSAKAISSDLDVTAGIIALVTFVVLPGVIFHAACIALYRISGDPKRIIPFTLVHALFNYCVTYFTPDDSIFGMIHFFIIVFAIQVILIVLSEATIRTFMPKYANPIRL